jgi:hypothetical protein
MSRSKETAQSIIGGSGIAGNYSIENLDSLLFCLIDLYI